MEKKLTMVLVCLFLSIGSVLAQTKVTGTVIAQEDGLPVIGATVMVKGTKTGTATDIDGHFTLSVKPGTKLEVSYIGMKSKTVSAKNGMKIVLESDATTLQDVVVTGMVKVDKRLFSGSSIKIDASSAKLDGVADISRSLEGKAAGVSVQNVSGTFGTAPKIRVRGATSIYGNSKPLWVVDGVIMEDVVDVSTDELSSGDATTLISSAIAGLNSDDIESFEILKDGSATSVYGARAMAGVIVVTTKKGKAGSTSLSYTGEYSMRLIPSYANFNIMNSQDQMGVYQELQQKGYLNYSETSNAANSGVYGKMYQMLNSYNATTGQFELANTAEAKAGYLHDAEYRNTNWFKELFSNSIQHTHSVSISGGNDKGTYRASVSAMYDPGWYEKSQVERYTANFNANYKISSKVTANIIGNASYRKQEAPGTISATTNPVTGEVSRAFDINPYSYALNSSRTLDPNVFYTRNYAPFNIHHELENNYIDLNVFDFRMQGQLSYKPIKKVELTALAAVKYGGTTQEHNIKDNSNQAQAYRAMGTAIIRDKNQYLYTDPDDIYALPVTILPNGGIMDRTDNRMSGYDFRLSASYNDVYAEDHLLNLYGAMEVNSLERHSTWFRGWGMQYEMGEIPSWAYAVFKKTQEEGSDYYSLSNTKERSAAFVGVATYSWKRRYSLTGTYRYEGTNRMGKSRSARWMPTWNISGAWNVHEEPWYDKISKVVSNLTFKLSYSLTADRGPSWVTNSSVVIKSNNPWRPTAGDKESVLYIDQLANEDLTYEKKHEFNFGFDVGFLNNRINLTFDAYTRRNYDLIGNLNTTGVGGEGSKYGNVAKMKSSGVELALHTLNIKTKDFSWSTDFIYSHMSNEVTQLNTYKRMYDFVTGTGFTMEGYPQRSLFSIPFMGLNSEGLPTFLDQDGNVSVTGINMQEYDPDKLRQCLHYDGPVDPTDVGSFGNMFKYKNLTLNVFMTYSFGNVVRLDPVFNNTYDDLTATPKEFNNRWVVPGDEQHTTVPAIASKLQNSTVTDIATAYQAYNYSTERVAKGDFIRMKEISVAYDFPKSFTQKLSLNNLSVKLQATNLFLLYSDSKLNGQDPEFTNAGGVATPMPKQFTLTLKFGL